MYVIAVYDISTIEKAGKKRLVKIMKTMRKYFHHTQKSVFEGEISEAGLISLKHAVKKIISADEDTVVFFRIDNQKNVKREMIGLQFDPTSSII